MMRLPITSTLVPITKCFDIFVDNCKYKKIYNSYTNCDYKLRKVTTF